jgi:HEPN domain-containing protein
MCKTLIEIVDLLIRASIGLFGVFVGYRLSRRDQKLNRRKERYHKIYDLLIKLHSEFFWLHTTMTRNDQSKIEQWKEKIQLTKIEINDVLGFHDIESEIEKVAKTLLAFKDHDIHQRMEEIKELLQYFGGRVNKKHWAIINSITEENQRYIEKYGRTPEIP